MNTTLIALIGYYASLYGVDPNVAVAVAFVESSLNPASIGKAGELGLFQLMPQNYPEYSKKDLLKAELNIKLGVKYLAWTRDNCNHKQNINYLVCYNYGIKNAEKVKYPHLFPYVRKVKKTMDVFQTKKASYMAEAFKMGRMPYVQ